MSSRWRRFEVSLPLRFNDGREVPGEWIAEAVLEIAVLESVDHFGTASSVLRRCTPSPKLRIVHY
jgi:hypothetical protein